jgi:hypothetical protein
MSRTRQLIESLEGFEGVPEEDPRFIEGTPERKAWLLKLDPPRSARQAQARGVDWFIKDGRRYHVTIGETPPAYYPPNSEKIARTRNLKRQSYGYRDVYSTRERDWPMPNRRAYYKRQERERLRRLEQEREEQEKLKGEGI